MYSVLIVDGEDVFLEGLKSIVDWEPLGFRISSTAPNGEKALAILRKDTPDVIVADVRMPRISGFELAEIVKQESPQTRVIILSGYDNFKFAQAADRFGVYQYLLKPCQEEDIQNVFSRLRKELDEEQAQQRTRKWARHLDLRREAEEVLQGRKALDQARTLLAWIERFTGASAAIIHLWICPALQGLSDSDELQPFNFPGSEELETLLNNDAENPQLVVAPTGRNQLGGILFAPHESVDRETEELFNRLRMNLTAQGEYDLFGAYTSVTPGEGWLTQNHYENLARAMDLVNRRTPGELFHLETMPTRSAPPSHFSPPAVLIQMVCELPENEEQQIRERLTQLRDEFFDAENVTVTTLEEWSESLTDVLSTKLSARGIDIRAEIDQFTTRFASLRYCITLDGLFLLLNDLLNSARERISARQRDSLSRNIREALFQIETNYNENISLEEIARGLKLSAPYLSKLFKRETGINFREYLLTRRIEIAKQLLTDGNKKVYMIAEAVGYPDRHYFSEVFKRKTGYTPLEFRRLAHDRPGQ